MPRIYTIMFFVSLVFFAVSVAALAFYGLNFGVDFKGGSILEIEFNENRPAIEEVQKVLSEDELLKDMTVNPSGEKGFLIKAGEITEEHHQAILKKIGEKFPENKFTEKRFDSIGPAIGQELRKNSYMAIAIVLVAIAVYMTIVFWKLSKTLSLLAMNASTLVALLHDVTIPMGIFAFLGHYYNVQISAIFVAAILTILGYTVSDKVVIFDRVRENILRGSRQGSSKDNLGAVVHKSVMQTLVRSINNTLTVILSSTAIYLFGGESIRYFALALMIGIFLGAYSSIFVASPLLVWGSEWSRTKSSSR